MIQQDISFSDYQSIPAFNSGMLKRALLKNGRPSMKHLKAAVEGKFEDADTTALKFGRAVHCRLLEPERYGTDILVATPCQAMTGKGKPCGARAKNWHQESNTWYCGIKSHAPEGCVEPRDYVSEEESERIERMAKALHDHEAMALFRTPGWTEATLLWDWNGHQFKGRLDKFTAVGPSIAGGRPAILDLKKGMVGALSDEDCRQSILRYRYHIQAAMYVDGVIASGYAEPAFYWIFIEDGEPYDLNIIQADEEDIQIGREEYRNIIRTWETATKQGRYHGYIYSLQFIRSGGLPEWYRQQWRNAAQYGGSGIDCDAPVAVSSESELF